MKRYIKSNYYDDCYPYDCGYDDAEPSILKVGDYVKIIGNSFHSGDWGIIVDVNEADDEYSVAKFGNYRDVPVFARYELELMENKPQ